MKGTSAFYIINKTRQQMEALPIVPFGTYKGKSVTELLADKKKVQWYIDNNILQKYPTIYNIVVHQTIVSNNSASKTPEHNSMQNMFLDDEKCNKIIKKIHKIPKKYVFKGGRCEFEGDYNWDVIFKGGYYNKYKGKCSHPEDDDCIADCYYNGDTKDYDLPDTYIEIKPSIGDDYPVVLRKMKNQQELTRAKLEREKKEHLRELGVEKGVYRYYTQDEIDEIEDIKSGNLYQGRYCLLVKDLNATSVTKEQLVEIFFQTGITVLFMNEVFDSETPDKLKTHRTIEDASPPSVNQLDKIIEENRILLDKLNKAEERIKQLEKDLLLANSQKQKKTVTDYFAKK
jgi:hypothetical protein